MSRRGAKPKVDRRVSPPAARSVNIDHKVPPLIAPIPRNVPVRQVLLALVCVAVGVAVHLSKGNYHPASIALLGLAVAAGLLALLYKSPMTVAGASATAIAKDGSRLVPYVLTVGIVIQLVLLLTRPMLPVGGEIDSSALTAAGVGMVGVAMGAAMCVAAAFFQKRPVVLLASGVSLMLVSHLAAGIATVQAAPSPPVDVILFQQLSAAELLDGGNPYSMTFPDLSFGTSPHYGPGLQADGKLLFGFPYPPLSLLLTTPLAILANDFRYTQALAFTLTGALIAFIVPLRRSSTPALASALFLLTPSGPFIIASGWTEPLVALMLAITVCTATRKVAWFGPALGLFWAIKQYVPLTAPLALLLSPGDGMADNKRRVRPLITAVVTTAVVSLPLALWDISGFWHSAVAVQFRQPFRPDAMSFLSGWYHATGVVLPPWCAFVALAVVQALSLWRLRRGPANFAVATAVSFLVFFAFSKQAFANYYFLVIAAVALAIAALNVGGASGQSDVRPPTHKREDR